MWQYVCVCISVIILHILYVFFVILILQYLSLGWQIQQTTPRLILPDRKRRGINMMKLTANLRSSRPKKKNVDPHDKKSAGSQKAAKKSSSVRITF